MSFLISESDVKVFMAFLSSVLNRTLFMHRLLPIRKPQIAGLNRSGIPCLAYLIVEQADYVFVDDLRGLFVCDFIVDLGFPFAQPHALNFVLQLPRKAEQEAS